MSNMEYLFWFIVILWVGCLIGLTNYEYRDKYTWDKEYDKHRAFFGIGVLFLFFAWMVVGAQMHQ